MGRHKSHRKVNDMKDMSHRKLLDGKSSEDKSQARHKHKETKKEHKRKREHSEEASRKHYRGKRKDRDYHRRSKSADRKKHKQRKKRKSSDSKSSSRSTSVSLSSSGKNSNSSSTDDERYSYRQNRKRSRLEFEVAKKDNCRENAKLLKINEGAVHNEGETLNSKRDMLMQKHMFAGKSCEAQIVRKEEQLEGKQSVCSPRLSGCLVDGGNKAESLEVELRQKALANLLRHKDASIRSPEHYEKCSLTREAYDGPKKLHANADIANSVSTVNVSKSLDTGVDHHRWPLEFDAVAPNTHTGHEQLKSRVEENNIGSALDSSPEEGEISRGSVGWHTGDNSRSNCSDVYQEVGTDGDCKPRNSSAIAEKANISVDKDSICSPDLKNEEAHESKRVGVSNKAGDLQQYGSLSKLGKLDTGAVMQLESKESHIAAAAPLDKIMVVSKTERAGPMRNINETLECKGISQESEMACTSDVAKVESGTTEDGFQEKTMSVMRGGELVQVNYKVYIPKRATELAKRRLRR